MQLKLPPSLHYPITVTELRKQRNENIQKDEALLSYTFQTTVTEGDELGNEQEVVKTFPAEYKSALEGTLKLWNIKKGTIVAHPKYHCHQQRVLSRD